MGDIRVYIGNLDPAVSQDEVDQECRRFGKLSSVWVARNPPGFAFVEFEDPRDAQDAVQGLNDVRLGQQQIKVQFAKNRGKNSAPPGGGRAPPPPSGGNGGGFGGGGIKHRAILKNLPSSFSWKELKDEMRRIGDVIYADVDFRGDGIVEFGSGADLEYAVQRLDGSKLDGNTIVVFKERDGPPPPGRRYEDERPPPPRDEYRRDGPPPMRDGPPPMRDGPPPMRDEYRRDDRPPMRDDYRRDDRGPPPPRDDYRRDAPPMRDDYRRDERDERDMYRREDRGPPMRDDYRRDGPPRDDYRRDDRDDYRRDDRGYGGRDDRRGRDDRD